MATTVVLTSVVKADAPSTRVYVNFSDGSQREFQSLAALQEWARMPDTDIALTQQLCIAYALARSADLSNIGSVVDKSFVFNLSAAQPIRVQ